MNAQEKITDIIEPASYPSDIYFENEGKKYFVNWNNGILRLTEYNIDSQYEVARIKMPYPFYKGKYLLAMGNTDIVSFNIETKELKRFPLPNNYNYYRFHLFDENKAIIKAQLINTNYPKYFVFDFDSGITDSPPNFGTPVAFSGSYIIYHSWSAILPDYNKYTLIDMTNFEKVVLLDNSKLARDFTFIDDEIWFYDAFDFVKSYSISENKFQSFVSLSLDFDASKQRFFKKDSLLISVATAHLINSVKTFNLNTQKVVNKYFRSGSDTKQWYIEDFNLFDSCIVTNNFYSELVKYDFRNGKFKVFPASLDHDFAYGIPRLKIKEKSVQYFKEKLYLIDLKNNEIDSFNWTLPKLSNGYSYISYFNSDIIYEDENEIIVTFEISYNYENFNQIIINKHNKQITELFLNPKISGLSGEYNRLLEVNEEVVAVGKNIYHIINETAYKLNEGPLYIIDFPTKNSIINVDGGIRFYENIGNDLVLNQFDGKFKMAIDTFFNFKNIMPDKFTYSNGIFFYTKSSKIYSIENYTSKEISPYDHSYLEMIIHENALYFHKGKSIYKFQNGELKTIGTIQHDYLTFYKTTNHLYIRGDGINYEIKNEQLTYIENADNAYFTELSFVLSDGSPLVSISTGLAYIKDHKLITLFNDSLGLVANYGDLGLLRRFGKTRLMNLKTGEWKDLPMIPDGRAVGISVNDLDTIIYSIHDQEREIRISKLVDLKEYVQIYSVDGFYNLNYSFDISGPSHNQLFLMGKILLNIDQNLKVELNDNFSGANYTNSKPTFIFINDHIYFLCRNDESGFQVYSYYVGTSQVEDHTETNLDISIYPNPAKDFITIKAPKGEVMEFYFVIHDMKGRVVDAGQCVEQIIKVDKLVQGTYVLCIVTKDGVLHGRFVKM